MARCGSCGDPKATVDQIKDCYAEMADQAAEMLAEMHAEAISSWCSGGGTYADAKVYAHVTATLGKDWGAYLAEQDEAFAREAEAQGTCDHGLSAALCCGPGHYPADDPNDF